MFLLRTALRNILRCKSKSILTIFLCIFLISLLNVYWGNIESNRRQLTDLAEMIPIYCRISNLNGSKVAGLDIPEVTVQNLQSSSHMNNLVFTVRLMAGEGAFSIDDWKEKLNISAIGANSIQGVEGISEEEITLKEGTSLDFLGSSDRSCIVSQSCMDERQWEIGDVVSLNLYYYFHKNEYSLKIEPLDLVPFEIVGSMENVAYDNSGYLPTEIVLPVEAVREIYRSREIPFSADSAFFYLQDPLKLNKFKAEMKEFHLLPQSSSAKDSDKGEALFVKDAVFIGAADRLRQGMDTLLRFLPMVLAIVIFVGYISSYLLVYNRKKDFSIMRSIGFRHKEVFLIFLLEQLLLALCGSLIQSIFSIVFIMHNGSVLFVVNLGFFLCFMAGVAIAVWRIGRSNLMEALSQND
ncbi:MAG: transporter permease [Firmicutes bacterium]|nr:transporter permease [Bacillota bacterium]